MSFVGHFTHTLDAKKRVFVPAKFREDLGDVFYITRKFDCYLSIYTEAEWEKCVETISALPESVAMDYQEVVLGCAQRCVPDAHGRILIDDALLNFAKIGKSAVFVGVGHQIRLFAEEVWKDRESHRDKDKIRSFILEHNL